MLQYISSKNKYSIYSHEKRPATDFTRITVYSPLKKTLFYPYYFILLPYIILQVILYSVFLFYLL